MIVLCGVTVWSHSPDGVCLPSGKCSSNNCNNNKSTHHYNHTHCRYHCYCPHWEAVICVKKSEIETTNTPEVAGTKKLCLDLCMLTVKFSNNN